MVKGKDTKAAPVVDEDEQILSSAMLQRTAVPQLDSTSATTFVVVSAVVTLVSLYLWYDLYILHAQEELITLGVLAVVVTFLLQDGMGAAAVRAYADASARTRGVEKADPANEATMYAIFQTNLVYWVLFGVLGRYVIPGMLSESVPGSPGLWHGGLSAVLPALLVFGHGRKWF